MDIYKYKQERLRNLIKESGLNQSEFARKIGVSAPALTNILKDKDSPGSRGIGNRLLAKIKDKLGVEETYFFPGKSDDALSLLQLNAENAETIQYISTIKDPKTKAMMVKIIKDAYKTALTLIEED